MEFVMGIVIALIGGVLMVSYPPIGVCFILFAVVASICGGGKK